MRRPGSSASSGRDQSSACARSAKQASTSSSASAAAQRFSGSRRSFSASSRLFVQQPLARQRAFARRQHLVLELLEFLGDVALGAGQRLPARVVRRRLVGLALADLDVVAVHAVVADLQRRDAAGGALARFQVDQELVGVGRQRAQLVEFGVVAVGEDAAVARQHRRLRRRWPTRAGARARRARPVRRRAPRRRGESSGASMRAHVRQHAPGRRAASTGRAAAPSAGRCARGCVRGRPARGSARAGDRRRRASISVATAWWRRRSDARDRAAADAASAAAGGRPSA